MTTARSLALLSLAALAACNSKVTSALDQDLQDKVNTVQDCFPSLYPHASDLLELTNSWRLNAGSSIPDPTGLTWSEQSGGSIDVTYVVRGTTISMTIVFYSPTGTAQDLNLTGATTLADAIDAAATELNTNFPSGDPFMVGDWTMSGGGITGSGALTGIIGGTGGGNELEEIRTTSATVSGGPPAVAAGTISSTGSPACTLTFETTGLITDQTPGQEYPEGTVTISVVGPDATVNGTMTFNATSTASVAIDTINGTFDLDLDAFTVTYVP